MIRAWEQLTGEEQRARGLLLTCEGVGRASDLALLRIASCESRGWDPLVKACRLEIARREVLDR